MDLTENYITIIRKNEIAYGIRRDTVYMLLSPSGGFEVVSARLATPEWSQSGWPLLSGIASADRAICPPNSNRCE